MARTQIRFTVPEQLHEELEHMATWLAMGNANEVGRHLMMLGYHSTQTTRAMRTQSDVVATMVEAIKGFDGDLRNVDRDDRQLRLEASGA